MKTTILSIAILTLTLISCGFLDTPAKEVSPADTTKVDTCKKATSDSSKVVSKILPPHFDSIKK